MEGEGVRPNADKSGQGGGRFLVYFLRMSFIDDPLAVGCGGHAFY